MTRPVDRPRRALVVDDEPAFAAFIATTLRKARFATTVAFDGMAALDCVAREKPDLITLDIHMPHETGLLFYRQMKSQSPFRDIPMLVITGPTKDDPGTNTMLQCFLETDFLPPPDAYLEKPVDPRDILSIVAALLDRSITDESRRHFSRHYPNSAVPNPLNLGPAQRRLPG